MRRLGLVVITAIALIAGPSFTATAAPALPSAAVGFASAADPSDLPALVDGDDSPVTEADQDRAHEALQAVEEIFSDEPPTSPSGGTAPPAKVAAAAPASPAPADATVALRDLALSLNALGRAPAGSELAQYQRPWDDGITNGRQRACTTNSTRARSPRNICLHWASTAQVTGNARDITANDWALNTVLPELDYVSTSFVTAGYRAPVTDRGTVTNPYSRYYGQATNWGGSAQTDVYLMDLGANDGLYGFCAFDLDDDGRLTYYPVQGKDSVPAFCVLDNDYASSQYRAVYPGESAKNRLQATFAHEYFHAVQFGYDFREDGWFMEATSTWSERVLYPAVPDNRQYYASSQIRYPSVSLDTYGGTTGALHYANWIYFQYLSRKAPAKTGLMPTIVRRMWEYADSRGLDQYSIQAVASALRAQGLDFATTFGQYAAANRRPRTYLSDATLPVSTARQTYRLRKNRKATGSIRINHLASATYRFVPRKIRPAKRKARVTVDMVNRALGSVAIVTVVRKNGSATTHQIRLNKRGNGSVRIPFSTKRVSYAELTLVNANKSYRNCSNSSWGYSCGGLPTLDGARAAWTFKS